MSGFARVQGEHVRWGRECMSGRAPQMPPLDMRHVQGGHLHAGSLSA
jgi:hypothetical protein